jgi:hypothetical protein
MKLRKLEFEAIINIIVLAVFPTFPDFAIIRAELKYEIEVVAR